MSKTCKGCLYEENNTYDDPCNTCSANALIKSDVYRYVNENDFDKDNEKSCGNCKILADECHDGKGYCKRHKHVMSVNDLCDGWESEGIVLCEYCNAKISNAEVFVCDYKIVCKSCFVDYTSFGDDVTDIDVGKVDEVNNPKHYKQLPIECKDVIKYFDACRGQAIKYIWRCEHKGKPIQDLKKAIFWLNEKIKMYESEGYDE